MLSTDSKGIAIQNVRKSVKNAQKTHVAEISRPSRVTIQGSGRTTWMHSWEVIGGFKEEVKVIQMAMPNANNNESTWKEQID